MFSFSRFSPQIKDEDSSEYPEYFGGMYLLYNHDFNEPAML